MPKPTVTVIVPTYNRREMLDRALRSIAAQTFQDYEIIVINDGGCDVADILEKYENVYYIKQPKNRGLSAARNAGLKAARGKYIAFLDDDDVLLPMHFRVLVDKLEAGARAAYTDAYWWINEKRYEKRLSLDYSRKELLKHNLFPVMCVMVRADIIKSYRFDTHLKSHEDYDMWLMLSNELDFVHVPMMTALYSKRDNSDQMSNLGNHIDYFHLVRERHNR